MRNDVKESMRKIGKILGITLAVYVCLRWLLPLVVPFFIAFLLAKFMNPLVEKLEEKLIWKRGIWSTLLVSLLFLVLGFLVVLFVGALLGQMKTVVSNMEMYKRQAGDFFRECCCQVEVFTGIQAKDIEENVQRQLPGLMQHMKTNVVPVLMNGTISYAKSMFIWVGICFVIIISTVLILKDYRKIKSCLQNHPVGQMGLKVCRRTYEAGGAYLKAQFIIMLIITAVCVMGLYLSGNEYALLTGCGIGICDAMPFLGTGTIFVPWALIEMLQGEYMLAVIYTVIYTICSILREILEPKLLGNKLGMHPLTVIVSIYVGLGIYGLWGFALGPLSYILIREIYLTI